MLLSNTLCYAQNGLRERAENGSDQDQFQLGLYNIQKGDYSEAIKWLTKSANQGNANAQFNLAIMYRDGEGCTVNYEQAMFWFRKAATNSKPRVSAYGEIGRLYQYGMGVLKDLQSAISWYQLGALHGDNYSMEYLGRIYRDSGNMEDALTWFRKGADAGNEECACYVYYILEDTDLKTALVYLKKSADAGYPNGMAFYGIRKILGDGVPKDEKDGMSMVLFAASKGSDVALDFLSKYKK